MGEGGEREGTLAQCHRPPHPRGLHQRGSQKKGGGGCSFLLCLQITADHCAGSSRACRGGHVGRLRPQLWMLGNWAVYH